MVVVVILLTVVVVLMVLVLVVVVEVVEVVVVEVVVVVVEVVVVVVDAIFMTITAPPEMIINSANSNPANTRISRRGESSSFFLLRSFNSVSRLMGFIHKIY